MSKIFKVRRGTKAEVDAFPIPLSEIIHAYDDDSLWLGGNSGNILVNNRQWNESLFINALFPPKNYTPIDENAIDNAVTLQAMLDLINLNGGGVLYIPKGVYNITSPLTLGEKTTIMGEGWNSILRTTLDIEMLRSVNTVDNLNYEIVIKNLHLKSDKTTGQNYEIHIVNGVNCRIDNVQIQNIDMNLTDKSGIFIDTNLSTGTGTFLQVISNCFLNNGSIIMDISDSKIVDSWIWGFNRDFAIQLTNASSNITIENCDIIPSPVNGGVFVNTVGAPYGVKIIGCHFDGSYDTIETGDGINAKQMYGASIVGNYFMRCKKRGIYMYDAINNTIQGNTFINNNRSDNFYSDIVIEGRTFSSSKNTVIGNTFRRSTNLNKGSAIEEVDNGATPNSNVFIGNTVDGSAYYKDPSILILGGNTDIKSNKGVFCKSENRGSATINSGTTQVVVNHGLDYTPTQADINITLTNLTTNPIGSVYVDSVDSSGFTIEIENDPGTSGAIFEWKVTI